MLTLATMTAAVWVFAYLWGSTAAPPAPGATSPRSVGAPSLLVAVVAVAGAAMGILLRHTAAVLGVALGWAVAGEGILRGAVPSSQPWLLNANLTGWLQHGTTYVVERCTSSDGGYSCEGVQKALSSPTARRTSACSWWPWSCSPRLVFRRRDVR